MLRIIFLLSTILIILSCSSEYYDLIIANGTIVDGSGKAKYAADIGILDGKIIKIEPDRVMVQKKEIRSWIYPQNSLTATLRDDPEKAKIQALAEVQ